MASLESLVNPGLSFCRDFRHVELGIHEQGEFERSANGQHILFRENQLGDPLPVLAQLPLFAYPGHVIARLADGAQRAAVFSRQRSV
jgi:hypothetical protein